MAHDRRAFLKALGLGTVALAAATRPLAALARRGAHRPSRLSKIGIQMYSVRDRASTDLAGTLAGLAKIGYNEVETAGYYGHTASVFRDLLDANHLKAPSAHMGIDAIERRADQTFADAKTIGHEWLVIASPPNMKLQTVEAWGAFAGRLNRAGAAAKEAGFRFAYHNHSGEFVQFYRSFVPWEVLMRETDPSLVAVELDLYHAAFGGAKPRDLLVRYGDRIKMLHVKDMSASNHKEMVDVGAGIIDFKSIFAHAKGIEHYFIENDNPADSMQFAANSYAYLSKLDF